MRGLTLAIAIMIFCLGVEMWNTLEEAHFNDTNQTITGWNPDKNPPIRYASLPYIGDKDTFESSFDTLGNPAKQSVLESIYDTAKFTIQTLSMFFNIMFDVFIKSTIGFFPYLQSFGRQGYTVVPTYIAGPVAVLVYMNYALMIGQFLVNRSLRAGV